MAKDVIEVNHQTLQELMKCMYQSKIPGMIWGGTGIGKSQAVKKASTDLGIGFIDVRLTQINPEDLKGLPKYGENNTTIYCVPGFLPKDGQGILFLDEINLVPDSIQAAAYQLILDRKVGDYILPEGWLCIAAGNRLEDRANVFTMAAPLRNRLLHVTLGNPSIEEWTEWALEKGVDKSIITFLQWKKDYLHTFKNNPDATVFASHRMWGDYVDNLLKSKTPMMDISTLVASAVGQGIAMEFSAFQKLNQEIDLKMILKEPQLVKRITAVDMKYCLVSALSGHYDRSRKALREVLRVCNEMDAEFGVLLARMLKKGNKYFNTDFAALTRTKDKTAKEFVDNYARYVTDEDIKE